MCAYARTFEPASAGSGPSGLADWPRPFVFRARHLDAETVPPDTTFHFDMNLFQLHEPPISFFVRTFAELGEEGLGPGRGRAELTSVEQIAETGHAIQVLFDGKVFGTEPAIVPSEIALEAPPIKTNERAQVRFLTPTELKHEHRIVDHPEFNVLATRIRDRLSTLSELYGDGSLNLDFVEFGRRAGEVKLIGCELKNVDVTRISSRTGQRHYIGGFVGVAEYEGPLAEFLPFLLAAQFTGVGRQTTWGKGEIEVVPSAELA